MTQDETTPSVPEPTPTVTPEQPAPAVEPAPPAPPPPEPGAPKQPEVVTPEVQIRLGVSQANQARVRALSPGNMVRAISDEGQVMANGAFVTFLPTGAAGASAFSHRALPPDVNAAVGLLPQEGIDIHATRKALTSAHALISGLLAALPTATPEKDADNAA